MKIQLLIFALLVGASTLTLTSCGGGGGGGHYYGTAWYDVYGYHCGNGNPRPGCNFYANGDKIVDFEDPYYSSSNILELKSWYYYDSYGRYSYYYGWAWKSYTGIIYTEYGTALNAPTDTGADIIGDVAAEEQGVIKSAGETFAAKYQLSAETGAHVAQVLHDWAVIGKDRARTQKDVEDFTQRLYGVDFNKVKNAVLKAQAGDKSEAQDVVAQAAANWKTNPETMKVILKDWFGPKANIE